MALLSIKLLKPNWWNLKDVLQKYEMFRSPRVKCSVDCITFPQVNKMHTFAIVLQTCGKAGVLFQFVDAATWLSLSSHWPTWPPLQTFTHLSSVWILSCYWKDCVFSLISNHFSSLFFRLVCLSGAPRGRGHWWCSPADRADCALTPRTSWWGFSHALLISQLYNNELHLSLSPS